MKSILSEEFKRMQKLAGLSLNEANLLNEDILELRQMSKQLYSLLKKKGFNVVLEEQEQVYGPGGHPAYTTAKSKIENNKDGTQPVHIVIGKSQDIVSVYIGLWEITGAILKQQGVTIDNSNRVHIRQDKFGDDSNKWDSNPEVVKFVTALGNELVNQIKSKYPDMMYKLERTQRGSYALHFGYGKTKKGGKLVSK